MKITKRSSFAALLAAMLMFPLLAGAVESLNELNNNLGLNSEPEILEPDQAFQFSTELKDASTIIARWQIAPKHYLYRDKFQFNLKEGQGMALGAASLPDGETKNDEFFGEIKVFHHGVEALIPINRSVGKAEKASIQFVYQGCAEETGICYPPIRKTISFNLPVTDSLATPLSPTPQISVTATPEKTADDGFVSEQARSAEVLVSGSVFEIISYFFLGGLALAFTACMYPMIPILSSIIIGHGESITRGKATTLSLIYVISMALTFGLMGALVAMFAGGLNLQAYFQSPWILIPFALVFVLLSLAMFGFYNIQLPASLQGKLSEFSNKQKGGSLIGVAIMGSLSALIIGPCAGPVIIGGLGVVASSGDTMLGFLSMLMLGLGLGVPLLIVGIAGGEALPRAGTWMNVVKAAAGVVLLGIALLFLERVSFIPIKLIMMLWATLFIVSGVYMGALETLREGASGWRKLWKGLGVVLIIYGLIVMLGGLTGARNVNDPLHGSSLTMGGGSTAVTQQHMSFTRIKSVDDLKAQLATAQAQGKYIMLDFYADWCTYCKQFEDYVFSNPEVQAQLKDFILLQADVTANDELDQALNKFTSVQAPPAILFFTPDGKEAKKYRIVGAMDAEKFMSRVKLVLAL